MTLTRLLLEVLRCIWLNKRLLQDQSSLSCSGVCALVGRNWWMNTFEPGKRGLARDESLGRATELEDRQRGKKQSLFRKTHVFTPFVQADGEGGSTCKTWRIRNANWEERKRGKKMDH